MDTLKPSFRFTGYMISLIIFWTIVVGASLVWNLYTQYRESEEAARVEARTSIRKDILYRYWNANHGGVYAPVTDCSPPNPYLSFIEDRDIVSESGNQYTMINPAYMTRQVFELGHEKFGIHGHITSLNPLRLENKADSWETKALEAFESGAPEYSETIDIEGIPYMRLMIPLETQDQCLGCHASQGYQLGDIRGGISVAIPLLPLRRVAREHIQAMAIGHSLVWLVGMVGLGLGGRNLRKRFDEQERADREAQRSQTITMLAGTIAHEFNNPLAIIKGSSDLLTMSEKRTNECDAALKKISRQVIRMSELVDKLGKLHTLKEIDYAQGVKILDLNGDAKS